MQLEVNLYIRLTKIGIVRPMFLHTFMSSTYATKIKPILDEVTVFPVTAFSISYLNMTVKDYELISK